MAKQNDTLITIASIGLAPFTGGLSLTGLLTTSGGKNLLGLGGDDNDNTNQIMET